MKIGIFGTGMVGRALAIGFEARGDDVTIGTRDVADLMGRTEGDQMGNPPFAAWHAEHPGIAVGTFEDAARHGELLVNATLGAASIDALTAAGPDNLSGKILIDASNALDHSTGFPPALFIGNTDSLGELIQRTFPDVRLVKAWNTVNASLMTNPGPIGDGDHTLPICGDDDGAKKEVAQILESFGWQDVLDLGDLTNARATEAYITLWIRAFMTLGSPMFNVKFVR